MRPARLLLLLVALVAGGLAAFLATRGEPPQTIIETTEIREVVQEARSQVLVATRSIGLGQRLTPADVTWQDWPEGAVRPEYITAQMVPDAPQTISGAVARFEIFVGEPIREGKLVRAEQGYLSAVITEGMRAVSLTVAAESGAGGFIVPNDRVDVVLTASGNGGSISETILSNVRVLAIGKRLGELGTTGNGRDNDNPASQTFDDSTIATLELSPRQSETVLNARANGRLALVLRSVIDFAESDAAMEARRSQSVRLIRYGQDRSVIAGTPGEQAMAPAVSGPAGNALSAPMAQPAPMPQIEVTPDAVQLQ